MSITGIPTNFFNTTVTIKRRSVSTDAIGAIVATWADVASVAGFIEPLKTFEKKKMMAQGTEFTAEFRLFCGVDTVIRDGDRIVDTGDGNKTYNVVGVDKFKTARSTITTGHHYEVYLEVPKETHT